ncbi:unnamed protein product [Citrullus colocynthis]|uniref:CHCH domain-containing protein n=1 Tax=Citrullus colocynthis TaxID=252529 RepID=A0ABP0XT41_9ROSI
MEAQLLGFFRSPPIVSPFPLLNKQAAAARLFLKSTYSSAMDEPQAHPVCAQEALNLLNCVTESPFDQEKCYRLLHSLRECVLSKKVKKFSLAEEEQTKPIKKNA